MIRMKTGLLALMMVAGTSLFAQSVQEAKKLIYYGRYQGAKDMLQKLVAGNPNDAEAVYWLSQAHIDLMDPAGAREVLRKGMEGANGSNPLLLVGMGHVELLDGKTADARQRFETALSLTKAKDVNVINAIGHANTEKAGDADYAIEKLKAATQIKGFKEPDVYINMGDAYRKKLDGGGAVSSYQNALTVDPKYAASKYKTAKVYLTQGADQKDVFLRNFEEAITLDPNYGPAYYDLYAYYFSRDVVKATDYFNKYKPLADPGPALDYEEASLKFAAGDFKGAIDKANQLEAAQGASADARLHRLKGYSYEKLGDSVNAVKEMEIFFTKARPDQIVGDNYVMLAMNSAKIPERQERVDHYLERAIDHDTSLVNKLDYARKGADFFKKAGNQQKAAQWMTRSLGLNPNPGKVDIYNAGFENFKAANYTRADSIFGIYKTKYPDEVYGHYWSFRSRSVIDSTMEGGLAVPDCQRFIEVAESDKVKNKNTLITAYGYMAGYNANVKKDFPTAIGFLDKILEVDPANADATKNKEILQKAMGKQGGGGTPAKPGGAVPPKPTGTR
jgi:Flp pilus assembly protein TadD